MSYLGSPYGPYGTTPQHVEAGLSQFDANAFVSKRRRRMSVKAIIVCLFVPWILFSLLYANATLSLHYSNPALCGLLAALGILVVLGMFLAAAQEALSHSCSSLVRASYSFMPFLKPVQESGWLGFLFFTSALAVIGGTFLGDLNYQTNMRPYYELQTLNTYDDVNPATSQGRQMMDAGRIIFSEDVALDIGKAYQFQDFDTYCVAPISIGQSPLKSYDFWAVGLNCCGFNSTKQFEYKCGPFKSQGARQGLRLMSESQRDYYKLAVQQAEAQYKIMAKHPLLFYWSEDAEADMKGYWEFGFKYLTAGIVAFLSFQIFLILVYTVLVSQFGLGGL